MDKVKRTDAEWRELLTPEEYAVLRQAGTEAPFTGEYTDTKTEGVYRCRACGAELFRSDAKFESHCGWPSFYQPTDSDAVVLIEDRTLGMARTEVRCASCDSHLGHVFTGEGYDVPTDQRWCINSVSLKIEPAGRPPRERGSGRLRGCRPWGRRGRAAASDSGGFALVFYRADRRDAPVGRHFRRSGRRAGAVDGPDRGAARHVVR